jgi:hypothetical protein
MQTSNDAIRIYLRTDASDTELKPYVDMAIAGTESLLGKSVLGFGEIAPLPVTQAALLLLGILWEARVADKVSGLLAPYIEHRLTK